MSEEREQLESRIAAYIDGELPEAEAARLEVFLANTDPKLAEQVIGMLHDKQKLRELPRGRAPGDLAGRVMEQVERATLLNDVEHLAHPQRSWWQTRVGIAAAVAVMVGGFGWLVINSIVPMGGTKNGWENLASEKGNRQVAAGEKPSGPASSSVADALAMNREREAGKDAGASEGVRDRVGGDRLAAAMPASPAAAPGKGGGVGDERAFAMEKKVANDKERAETEDIAIARADEAVQVRLNQNSLLVQNAKQSEAIKQEYAPTDTAAKALTTLASMDGSMAVTDPIVVTLVARNEQDPVQLRNTLAGFMAADPTAPGKQAVLLKRYANMGQRNAYTGGVVINGGNTTTNSGGASGQVMGNTTTNSAGTLFLAGNNDYQIYNKSNQKFDQYEVNGIVRSQSQVVTQNNFNTNGDLSAPYRVVLREDQLKELTGLFHVYSLSCGRQAFVITEPSGKLTDSVLADASPRGGALKPTDSSGLKAVTPAPVIRAKTAATMAAKSLAAEASAAAPAEGALAKSEGKDAKFMAELDKDLLKDGQDAGKKIEVQAAQKGAGDSAKWLDCVIKMEPRPGQLNSQNLQVPAAGQQSK